MQPLSQVSEREERESSTREYRPFKVPRRLSNPGLGVYILPLPVTSRYGQNAYLADCPRCPRELSAFEFQRSKREVNGWQGWPLGRADRPPGPRGPSAWAPRTVREQAADHPPGPPSCTLFCSVLKRITDRPQEARGLSAWKRIFSKTFAKNLIY
jgi:hypothetical protein